MQIKCLEINPVLEVSGRHPAFQSYRARPQYVEPMPVATGKQRVLQVIEDLTDRDGVPPTLQAVGDVLGITRERVRQLAAMLRKDGLLEPVGNGIGLVLPGGNSRNELSDKNTLEEIRRLTVPGKPPPTFSWFCEQSVAPSRTVRSVKRLRSAGKLYASTWLVETSQPEYTHTDYFWSHVNIGAEDDCWPWVGGSTHSEGYGHFNWSLWTDQTYSHRMAYELTHGKGSLEEGKWIYHTCARKGCCNPKHLVQCLPSEWTSHMESPRWSCKPVFSREEAQEIRNLVKNSKSILSAYQQYKDLCTYGTFRNIAVGESYK